jgi:hypothetical protein
MINQCYICSSDVRTRTHASIPPDSLDRVVVFDSLESLRNHPQISWAFTSVCCLEVLHSVLDKSYCIVLTGSHGVALITWCDVLLSVLCRLFAAMLTMRPWDQVGVVCCLWGPAPCNTGVLAHDCSVRRLAGWAMARLLARWLGNLARQHSL